jgi:Domain of unknown function (DUF4166)
MPSIYQRALGEKFKLLHPRIQQRFGFSSADGLASIGTGTMETVWHGALYTMPFLYLGSWRHIMFPEQGRNIPFTIKNYAYLDDYGRETVTWLRTFQGSVSRRFDAYMIYSERRGLIVDYLGTHQHLAVDIHLEVDQRGGLRLCSGAQRFYEGPVAFGFPMIFSGVAEVCEWYDDADSKFHIEVNVRNKLWGPLFGYRGTFQVEWLTLSRDQLPREIFPLRCDPRE